MHWQRHRWSPRHHRSVLTSVCYFVCVIAQAQHQWSNLQPTAARLLDAKPHRQADHQQLIRQSKRGASDSVTTERVTAIVGPSGDVKMKESLSVEQHSGTLARRHTKTQAEALFDLDAKQKAPPPPGPRPGVPAAPGPRPRAAQPMPPSPPRPAPSPFFKEQEKAQALRLAPRAPPAPSLSGFRRRVLFRRRRTDGGPRLFGGRRRGADENGRTGEEVVLAMEGPAGPPGAVGPPGAQGDQGVQGKEFGDPGEPGARGSKGSKGKKGPSGEEGDPSPAAAIVDESQFVSEYRLKQTLAASMFMSLLLFIVANCTFLYEGGGRPKLKAQKSRTETDMSDMSLAIVGQTTTQRVEEEVLAKYQHSDHVGDADHGGHQNMGTVKF